MLDKGNIPTHVILTIKWDREIERPSFFNPLGKDLKIFDKVFPFRYIFHDIFNFLSRSKNNGGIVNYYIRSKNEIKNMLRSHGYYFIFSDSINKKTNSLPDDFSIDGDTPKRGIKNSAYLFKGSTYRKLIYLSRKYKFKIIIVPMYYRIHKYKPISILDRESTNAYKTKDGIVVIDKPYVSMQNNLFSDPAHANKEGAFLYTNYIIRIFNNNNIWSK